MDYDKLIERLRTDSLYADKASLEIMDLCMDAATALSTLQAENGKLREKVEDARLEGYAKGLGEMSADLARVTEERDAAVEDLEEIMFKGGHNIDTCHFCTNGQCYGRGGTQVCEPKWRGIKKEDRPWHSSTK